MSDYCTVISVFPFDVDEAKPGLFPGDYFIPKAKFNDIEFLLVGPAKSYVYIDGDRGSIAVAYESHKIAQSICEDYKKSKLAYIPNEAEPGLFWIPGEYKDKKTILAVAAKQIEEARKKQELWFRHLVEIADDEWNKFHMHKSISDEQRYACDFFQLEREWNVKGQVEASSRCPACATMIPSSAIVCPNCHTIVKPDEYKKLNFKTVGV